jgi:hypothetical protein
LYTGKATGFSLSTFSTGSPSTSAFWSLPKKKKNGKKTKERKKN